MYPENYSAITAIEYALPEATLDNEQLVSLFPEWNVEKIEKKTGIRQRHITTSQESALDLGVAAARKLFNQHPELREKVDALLFCTESPDYCLPPNACLAQDMLGLRTDIPATDFSLGCSGFVFGLSLAHGWISSLQARCVLLITAETYSKYLAEKDKTVRTIFGDAGAAVIVEASEYPGLTNFVFATDGKGGGNLIVPHSGAARTKVGITENPFYSQESRTPANLFMQGAEVFQFTLRCVPDLLHRCLIKSGKQLEEVEHFVLHQANLFMLEHLRVKCQIPQEKFITDFEDTGNTVSCSIPIVLKRSLDKGKIKPGETIFIAGFGVGYSACAALIQI